MSATAVRDAPLVAELTRRGRLLVAEPFFERGPRMTIDAGAPTRRAGGGRGGGGGGSSAGARTEGAREGDLVLLRPGGRGAGRGRAHAVVERVIGRPDVARDVLEALMLSRGLRRGFDGAVERAARDAAGELDETVARRDLRELPTFTIDPVSARDFDDAISCEQLGDGRWRVWVHIADVSAYVRPGSPVDREARRRATSVYVPGLVEPMLPESLSNGACSLVPDEERLAVTVEMDLRGAERTRARFYRSRIRSDVRLDYEQVDEILAGRERAQEPWAAGLAAARAAAAALNAARAERGALLVDSAEPEFAFDENGHVTHAAERPQTESHRLIEHLMIAANEAVATHLATTSTPCLYRVHERPEPAAVERLFAQLASLGVPTPALPDQVNPQQATDLVAEASVLVDRWVRARDGLGRAGLTGLVLRSLKQARYDPRNAGHAGLHSTRYCHFTSPIRRYPDLICHRALLASIGAGEQAPDGTALPEAGAWCSQRERDAMSIERGADDVTRAFLLRRLLFEQGPDAVFNGEVVGVIGAGAFVAFGEGFEGMLPMRRLRDDWYGLNEEGTILTGTRTGKTIRIGDAVLVEVERVDTARGRVDLVPVRI